MNLYFHNKYHQGDCIYHIHYCNLILDRSDKIESIVNYFDEKYIQQANDFIRPQYKDVIINKPFDNSNECRNSIDCWINRNGTVDKWLNSTPPSDRYFDIFYGKVYDIISNELGLNISFSKEDNLFDEMPIWEGDSYDVLLINSKPLSNQCAWDTIGFDRLIYTMKQMDLKIITTAKSIAHYTTTCTLDSNMSLFDIASLSSRCKNIIGVHTSPYIVSVNKNTIEYCENMIAIQNQGLKYDYPNFKVIGDIQNNFDSIISALV